MTMKRTSGLSKHRLNPKESNSLSSARHKSRRSSRERRGIGAIIGGTILAAIIFTSFFTYFMTVMQSQSEKGKVDMQASTADDEKKMEIYKVSSATCGSNPCTTAFPIIVNNTGPVPLNATYAVVFPVNDPGDRALTPLQLVLV